jgi:putative ABC transport system permease protein
MIAVALKGLAQHRLRTVLTALAIVVGVATMTAAFTLSDTMRKGADAVSSSSYDGTAAVVSAKTAFDRSTDGYTKSPTIPGSTLDAVRAVPEVGVAVGDLTSTDTRMLSSAGDPVGDGPYFGIGLDSRRKGFERVTPLRLQDGRWATGPGQVVIDAGTADKQGLEVGETVAIAAAGPAQRFRVVGVARWGEVKTIGTATVAVFDLGTAQRLFGSRGALDSILVAGRPGTSGAEVRRALAAALPGTVQVQSAVEHDRFTIDGLSTFVDIVGIVLLAFAGVAILVGAFTIFNTLSITVAQRAREFGLLRMVGAGRRQVLGSVLVEALVIGALASAAGLAAGLGLAKGLNAALVSLGIDLPQTGTVFATRTIVVSALVGTIVTVLAGVVPAWRATRIAPVAALRAVTPDGRELGLPGRAVRAVTGLLGRPAQVLGGSAGRLARRNAMRNPGRVAVTALALTIGVALVTAVSVLGQGLKDTTSGSLQDRLSATHVVVDKDGWTPVDASAKREIAAADGVRTVSGVRQDGALAFGDEEGVNVVDPATVGRVLDFEWERGDRSVLAGLGRDGAIADEGWASEHGLTVGERFTITSAAGEQIALRVEGIESSPVIDILGLGPITISEQAARAAGLRETRSRFVFVDAPGADAEALSTALAGHPQVEIQTADAFIDTQAKAIDPLLGIFYVLLALAVIVSLFGLVNALVLSTFERTRELGMLRAVGMSRRQLRRMVRHESIITAVLGAALGMAAGMGLAALAVAQWGDVGLAFGVPAGALVAFTLVAVVAGVLAAVLPARRASRMDVLDALAYE